MNNFDSISINLTLFLYGKAEFRNRFLTSSRYARIIKIIYTGALLKTIERFINFRIKLSINKLILIVFFYVIRL